MKRKLKITPKLKTICAVVAFSIAAVFFSYLFLGKDFVISYDTRNQQIPLYTEFRNIVYSGHMPFWSNNLFLGTNFWASKTFYLLGDCFGLIVLATPFLKVMDALLLANIVRCIVSIVGVYLLLDKIGIKLWPALAAGVAYTFSSWMMLLYGMSSFASIVALFPYLILAIELYVRENRFMPVIISTFLIASSCYYMFWSVSVFMVFYWPTRYFLSHEWDLKKFFLSSCRLVAYYLLGTAIAMPLLLPTLFYMRSNSRVGGMDTSLIWRPLRIYFDMFIKFISSGVYANKEIGGMFSNNNYRLDQIGLFTSCLASLTLPQFFAMQKGQRRLVSLLSAAALSLMLICPIGGSLFHGLSEPSFRWVFMLDLFFCVAMAYVLNNADRINYKLLFATYATYCAVASFLMIRYNCYSSCLVQFRLIILSLVLMLIYCGLLYFKKSFISLLVILEVSLLGFYNNYLTPEKYVNGYDFDEMDKYLDGLFQDDEFYRVYIQKEYTDIDYQTDIPYNANLVYNFKDFCGYDSTLQPSTSKLLNNFEQYFWWYQVYTHNLLNTLCTKYMIVKYDWEAEYYGVEILKPIDGTEFLLCYNPNYRPFGYTCNAIKPYNEFASMDFIWDKDGVLADHLVIDKYDIEKYGLNNIDKAPSHQAENLIYSNNRFEFDIETTTDEILYIPVSYDAGWKMYVDGNKTPVFTVNSGLMGALLHEGNHHIVMKFVPQGFVTGTIIAIASIVVIILIAYTTNKQRKKTM